MAFWSAVFIITMLLPNSNNSYMRNIAVSNSLKFSNKKFLVAIYSIPLLLILGLRDKSVGSDTYAYSLDYLYWGSIDYSDLVFSFTEECGYKLIQYLFYNMGIPWQLFLFILSSFMVYSISVFIYRYSKTTIFTLLLYLTIGIFAMNMTGIRQSVAVCICLFAYYYLENQNDIKFSLLVIVASTIHYTAFAFFVAYFIRKYCSLKKINIILFALLPIIVRLSAPLFESFFRIVALDKYFGNGYFTDVNLTINPLAELVPFSILLTSAVLLYLKDKITQREIMFFAMTSVYVCCYELTHAVYMAGRLSFYFSMFVIALLDNLLFCIKYRTTRLLIYTIVVVCSILFFIISIPGSSYNIHNYMFF